MSGIFGGPNASLAASPTFFNFSPTNLNKWRAGLGRVRTGTGTAKIACVGDSTTCSAGSGTSGTENLVDAYPNGYTTSLGKLLTAAGVPASNNSFSGEQSVTSASGITYPAYDTRVTLGTNWGLSTFNCPAGLMFMWTSGTAGTMSFRPAAAFTTMVIYYVNNPSANGTFTVNVAGGATLATVNSGAEGTLSVQMETIVVPSAVQTINLVATANSGPIYIIGITTYTPPQVIIEQLGSYGSAVAGWQDLSSPWTPLNFPTIYEPDLTIICLTINDSNGPSSLPVYQTQLQAIITAAAAVGDVMLMTGVPSGTTLATNGTLAQFVAVNYALASANNIPLIDLVARWQSYALSNTFGLYFDTFHPNAVGYYDVAQAVATKLLAI